MVAMYHPELPDQEIEVVDPRGVAIHRQSGWRTVDELPKSDKSKNTPAARDTAKTEEK